MIARILDIIGFVVFLLSFDCFCNGNILGGILLFIATSFIIIVMNELNEKQ